MYQEHPAAKKQILDQLESAQTELKSMASAKFLGTMANVGAGLVEVPGLGILAGAAGNWAQETLNEVSDRLVADVGKIVTPCEDRPVAKGLWKGTLTQTSVTHTVSASNGETAGYTSEKTETISTTVDVTGVKMETDQDGIVILAQLTGKVKSSYTMAGSSTGWNLTYCGEGHTTKQVRHEHSGEENAGGEASGEASIMVTISLSGQYFGSTSYNNIDAQYEGVSSSKTQKCTEVISESHTIGPNSFQPGGIDFGGSTDPTAPLLTGSTTETQGDTTTTTTWSLARS